MLTSCQAVYLDFVSDACLTFQLWLEVPHRNNFLGRGLSWYARKGPACNCNQVWTAEVGVSVLEWIGLFGIWLGNRIRGLKSANAVLFSAKARSCVTGHLFIQPSCHRLPPYNVPLQNWNSRLQSVAACAYFWYSYRGLHSSRLHACSILLRFKGMCNFTDAVRSQLQVPHPYSLPRTATRQRIQTEWRGSSKHYDGPLDADNCPHDCCDGTYCN